MAAFAGFGRCILQDWFLLGCLNDCRDGKARDNSRKHSD